MRDINKIIVHCTATPEGRETSVADIRSWHKQRGWSDIGYHYVVQLDGTVNEGRPVEIAGAHVKGQNKNSIGITYVGGVDKRLLTPKDTRTKEQKESLLKMLDYLKTSVS
jgi:N-acetylmuramoyl-L-alanine amidase